MVWIKGGVRMITFYAFARTKSGSDIGRVKVEIDTDLPLSESDILTLEEETDEVGY